MDAVPGGGLGGVLDRRAGLEGVVVKPMGAPYQAGRRAWAKIRRRDTTEAIIGAITGALARPHILILGRPGAAGRLGAVGRTGTLRLDVSRQVATPSPNTSPHHADIHSA
ncbi:hypothetical protein [Streptomyces sp. NPDC088762]|uniref:hypothetical protein n=1 Tax=Streptomyces sp. NPDC088762 TaxID=3365891 RepID=UPI00381B299F